MILTRGGEVGVGGGGTTIFIGVGTRSGGPPNT